MVGWLFALLSYHSWVLFSSLTVTYVLYLNTFLSAIEPLFLALSAHPMYTVIIVPLFVTCDCVTSFFVSSLNMAKAPFSPA